MRWLPRLRSCSLLVLAVLLGCAETRPYISGYSEGVECQDDGEYAEAVTHYEKYIKDQPDTPLGEIVLYRIGQCYEAMGNAEKAAACYQKTIEADKGGVWASSAKTGLERLKATE